MDAMGTGFSHQVSYGSGPDARGEGPSSSMSSSGAGGVGGLPSAPTLDQLLYHVLVEATAWVEECGRLASAIAIVDPEAGCAMLNLLVDARDPGRGGTPANLAEVAYVLLGSPSLAELEEKDPFYPFRQFLSFVGGGPGSPPSS